MGRRAILTAGCALFLAACSIHGPGERATHAKLRVVADPASASVYINERFVASARVLAKKPVTLKPGPKRITVQASGYFPHDLILELPPGETKLEIELRPVPR